MAQISTYDLKFKDLDSKLIFSRFNAIFKDSEDFKRSLKCGMKGYASKATIRMAVDLVIGSYEISSFAAMRIGPMAPGSHVGNISTARQLLIVGMLCEGLDHAIAAYLESQNETPKGPS